MRKALTTGVAGVAGVIGTAVALALASPAAAAVGGPVSQTPKDGIPQIGNSGTDGTTEIIRQLVPCGPNMYAVGQFTSIKRYTTSYARGNAFSFNATTGVMTAWNPNVNGIVDSIALSPDCKTAYIGGQFTTIGSTAVKNIAAVDTTTGAVSSTFTHNAAGRVAALSYVTAPTSATNPTPVGHVLAGGYYTSINGSAAHPYLTSLSPTTGRDDNYSPFVLSGNYVYTDQGGQKAASNATRVWNFSPSPDGKHILAMGDFTTVTTPATATTPASSAGRRQMFMIDLSAGNATLSPWYSSEFDQNCATVEPFWLQDASWSPDQSKIYIATTGYKPATGDGYYTNRPRTGLCDAAAAFPYSAVAPAPVGHLWINYTGCDSLFSTAADQNTVYIGGHERYANNPVGCDGAGAGAVAAPGMAGLSPSTGLLTFNPTRARGQGADDMVVTPAGLWIASDNLAGSQNCGKTSTGATAYGHAGICFLPY